MKENKIDEKLTDLEKRFKDRYINLGYENAAEFFTKMIFETLLKSNVSKSEFELRQEAREKYESSKGNFSKFLKGERDLSGNYIYAFEKLLRMPLYVLLSNDLTLIKENDIDLTLKLAAKKNSYDLFSDLATTRAKDGNPLINQIDEYQNGVFEYIFKENAIEGIRYMVQSGLLKCTNIHKTSMTKIDTSSIPTAFWQIEEKQFHINLFNLIIENDEVELFEKLIDNILPLKEDEYKRNYNYWYLLKEEMFLDKIYNNQTHKILNWLSDIKSYDKKVKLRELNKANEINTSDELWAIDETYIINPLVNHLINYGLKIYDSQNPKNIKKLLQLLKLGTMQNQRIKDILSNKFYLKGKGPLSIEEDGYIKIGDLYVGNIATIKEIDTQNINIKEYQLKLKNKYYDDFTNEKLKELYQTIEDIKEIELSTNNPNLKDTPRIIDNRLIRNHIDSQFEIDCLKLLEENNFELAPRFIKTDNNKDYFSYTSGYKSYFANDKKYEVAILLVKALKQMHHIFKTKSKSNKLKINEVYVHNNLIATNLVFDSIDRNQILMIDNWQNTTIGKDYEDFIQIIFNWLDLNKYDQNFLQTYKYIKILLDEYGADNNFKKDFAKKIETVANKILDQYQIRYDNKEISYQEYENKYSWFYIVLAFIDLYEDENKKEIG